MEFNCGGGANLFRRGPKKISLEQYFDFIWSHKQLDLSVNNLNQIINIHGLRQLKKNKKVLVDAMKSVDLMELTRSTVKDDVSSCAFITLPEVIQDLMDINWQECSITSIQTLNSVDYDFNLASNAKPKPKPKPDLAPRSSGGPRTKVRRLGRAEDDGSVASAVIGSGGGGSCSAVAADGVSGGGESNSASAVSSESTLIRR